MQFTREPATSVSIRRVDSGRITIGDQTYEHTIAIAGGELLADWRDTTFERLSAQSLAPLLTYQPDVVIVGYGWAPRKASRELVFGLARLGLGLECMDTPAACRTLNILVAEGRNPAAVLYLE